MDAFEEKEEAPEVVEAKKKAEEILRQAQLKAEEILKEAKATSQEQP